jgi:hypothetical protein
MLGPITHRRALRAAGAGALIAALLSCASARANETVQACGSFGNNVFTANSVAGIVTPATCPTAGDPAGGLALGAVGTTHRGDAAQWQTVAPPGLELVGATASGVASSGVNAGYDYGGGFYWAGGGASVNAFTPSTVGMAFASPSNYFGMQLVCGKSTCKTTSQFKVGEFSLYVRETAGPSFSAPTGLWQSRGWVRGTWPFLAWGDSPSGLCSLSATLNRQLINTSSSQRDVSRWHQCAAPPISQPVNTSRYGQGAVRLTLSGWDAAALTAVLSRTVYVDNSTPRVAMSGPTDAPSTAGIQYVSAAASGGPSGIARIVCSIDGGPAHVYAGARARVPVAGVGQHTVRCYANDNAVDPSGVHGRSAIVSWPLKIGQPTIAGIAFDKLVGLRCHSVRVRVRVPGRWITIRYHGRRMRVRTRAHDKLERVRRCHPRTTTRHTVVVVRVRRHGHLVRVRRVKTVRVVVPPHVVAKTSRRVRFGHATTVSGWLGTSSGVAIPGHTIHVLTAPDDGRDRFTVAATATTRADGTWRARLPAGPSRIVEALYSGDPTTEGAWSGQVHLVVPAKVKLLSVLPARVPWGGTVRITGRLLGGYLPPGGALVRLRIGIGSSYTTYGVQEHVTGKGRFTTTYTFGAGYAGVHRTYWFQIASLPMGSYPYAPANSHKVSVTVGGHPHVSCCRSA